MSLIGTSRHFAAAQQFGRFRGEADMVLPISVLLDRHLACDRAKRNTALGALLLLGCDLGHKLRTIVGVNVPLQLRKDLTTIEKQRKRGSEANV